MPTFMQTTAMIRQARRCWLVLAVCIAVLSIASKSRAGPRQAEEPAGTAAADQAYREVAANNYAGGIQDFRKALAADPLNSVRLPEFLYHGE